ncbi:aspartate 1-decarboxylase [Streptomyces sp. NPDC060064]|uniref:aspartate 1-decarboxylase n=1 Tax=Streptomyces sp. NPDC060064 TaxID=3347049 RepID=UPI0036C470BB
MFRELLKSKIHRATVTHADLHYVGSITIDSDLLEAAGLVSGEKVDVVDINNGARLSTYAIEGEPGSGVIGINGAAARLVSPGDLVIIIGYGMLHDSELEHHRPQVVFVDSENRITGTGADLAEPVAGTLRGEFVR